MCRARLTQVAVDPWAGPAQDRVVLFLGSEDGRVLKVLVSTQRAEDLHPDDTHTTHLLEEIHVYNPDKYCTNAITATANTELMLLLLLILS